MRRSDGCDAPLGFVGILLLFLLFWPADRAALQTMKQSLPPGPALFFELVLNVEPVRSKQLFSKLRIAYSHGKTLAEIPGKHLHSQMISC